MAGKEFTTKGGAKLFVSYSSFEEGLALVKCVNKVMLDLKLFEATRFETTLRLFGDAEVYGCYMRCAEKATYNGKKVNNELFANTAQGDASAQEILEIFDTVVHYNTSRFFPAASSASSTQSPAA